MNHEVAERARQNVSVSKNAEEVRVVVCICVLLLYFFFGCDFSSGLFRKKNQNGHMANDRGKGARRSLGTKETMGAMRGQVMWCECALGKYKDEDNDTKNDSHT